MSVQVRTTTFGGNLSSITDGHNWANLAAQTYLPLRLQQDKNNEFLHHLYTMPPNQLYHVHTMRTYIASAADLYWKQFVLGKEN